MITTSTSKMRKIVGKREAEEKIKKKKNIVREGAKSEREWVEKVNWGKREDANTKADVKSRN